MRTLSPEVFLIVAIWLMVTCSSTGGNTTAPATTPEIAGAFSGTKGEILPELPTLSIAIEGGDCLEASD